MFSKVCLLTLGAVFTGAAMANQVTLINNSNPQQPLEVVYKVAYKNRGSNQPVHFGPTQQLKLTHSITLPIELNGYDLGGIVPISITGPDHKTHTLPPNVNQFAQRNQCS